MKIAMDSETKKVQTEKTFRAFREQPKTMMQVSEETGILRSNICRYVAKFRKHKKIAEVRKDRCPITKHQATFFSTDPEYFPEETQPELFQIEGCRV